VIRTVTQLTDRNAGFAARLEQEPQQAASRRVTQTGPPCPIHRGVHLDGGPVQHWCPLGHSVMAADIDHEHHASGAA
jgi:predicted GNAT family acetyltransferase